MWHGRHNQERDKSNVVVPLVNDLWVPVTVDVTDLVNFILNNWEDVDLSDADLTYSATAKGHKLIIPSQVIYSIARSIKTRIETRCALFRDVVKDSTQDSLKQRY